MEHLKQNNLNVLWAAGLQPKSVKYDRWALLMEYLNKK